MKKLLGKLKCFCGFHDKEVRMGYGSLHIFWYCKRCPKTGMDC